VHGRQQQHGGRPGGRLGQAELSDGPVGEDAYGVLIAFALLVLLAVGERAGGVERGEHRMAVSGRVDRGMHESPVHAGQGPGRPYLRGDLLMQERGLAMVEGGQQIPAVVEVLVHQCPAHAGPVSHRLHRHAVNLAGGDQRGCRVQQGLVAVGPGQPLAD
jgi:hypothetical protein